MKSRPLAYRAGRSAKKHAAADAVVKPSPERRRRAYADGSRIVRVSGRELIDAHGNVATPFRVVDTLELMHRAGSITAEMHAAGNKFATDFALAQHDALRVADLQRAGGGNGSASTLPLRIENARRRVWAQLRSVGGIASPCGSCLWHVVGMQQSLNEWARTQGWAGRYVSPKAASGILIGALGMLAEEKEAK